MGNQRSILCFAGAVDGPAMRHRQQLLLVVETDGPVGVEQERTEHALHRIKRSPLTPHRPVAETIDEQGFGKEVDVFQPRRVPVDDQLAGVLVVEPPAIAGLPALRQQGIEKGDRSFRAANGHESAAEDRWKEWLPLGLERDRVLARHLAQIGQGIAEPADVEIGVDEVLVLFDHPADEGDLGPRDLAEFGRAERGILVTAR
jgi:hypothetical protein